MVGVPKKCYVSFFVPLNKYKSGTENVYKKSKKNISNITKNTWTNKLLENIVSLWYGNVSHTLYYLNIFILILYTMLYSSCFHDLWIYFMFTCQSYIFSVYTKKEI